MTLINVTPATDPLPRNELAAFLPTPRAVRAFEGVQTDVTETLPDAIGQIVDQTNALSQAPYVTFSVSPALENERVLSAGYGISLALGGGLAELSLTATTITPGVYGGPSSIPSITLDDRGRALSATNITLDSDNITEGAINLYFSNARARLALGAGTGIVYNNITGQTGLDLTSPRNVDHSAVSVLAGIGLTGGGTIDTDRTLNLAVQTASGAYTPTITNVTNVAAYVPHRVQWLRVGNIIHLSGSVEIDPTATGIVEIGISLPVASNFAVYTDANGVGVDYDFPTAVVLLADVTNDRLAMQFNATNAANQHIWFTASYSVI